MRFYLARLDRRWPCGNYKIMLYYVQARRKTEALRHVRRVHAAWRLLSLRRSLGPRVPE